VCRLQGSVTEWPEIVDDFEGKDITASLDLRFVQNVDKRLCLAMLDHGGAVRVAAGNVEA